MAIAPVVAGTTIDPTTFGNAVVDELNHRGLKQIATRNSDATPFTTAADVSSMSITWTATSSRQYRVVAFAALTSSTSGDHGLILIADGSNNQKAIARGLSLSTSVATPVRCEEIVTGLSGSVTRKMRAGRSAGSGNITVVMGSGALGVIYVEDIGPA